MAKERTLQGAPYVTGLDEPASYSLTSDEKGEAFHGEVKTWLNDDAYPQMAGVSGIISDIMR